MQSNESFEYRRRKRSNSRVMKTIIMKRVQVDPIVKIKEQLSKDEESESHHSQQSIVSILESSSSSSETSQKSLKSKYSRSSTRKPKTANDEQFRMMQDEIFDQYQNILQKAENKISIHNEQFQEMLFNRVVDRVNEVDDSVISENGDDESKWLSSIISDFNYNQSNSNSSQDSADLDLELDEELAQSPLRPSNFNSPQRVFSPSRMRDLTMTNQQDISSFTNKLTMNMGVKTIVRFKDQSDSSLGESMSRESEILDPMSEIITKHQRLYLRNPYNDCYYVQLTKEIGFNKIKQRYVLLINKYRLIIMMNIPVQELGRYYIQSVALRSDIYKLLMAIVIIINVTTFIYENLQESNSIVIIQQVLWYIYLIESICQILAVGIFSSKNTLFSWLFDLALLILLSFHIHSPKSVIDLSALRLLRLLVHLSAFVVGLKKMLKAMMESFKFILESTSFVILSCLILASIGLALFQGLFTQHCQQVNITTTTDWIQCIQGTCSDGLQCIDDHIGPDMPSNFDNIIYSFGQILRTVTMDDWSWVMYFTMRAYHPVVFIYYLLVIFVGGYFGFNLPIAVFKTHFSEAQIPDQQTKQPVAYNLSILKYIGFHKQLIEWQEQINDTTPIHFMWLPELEKRKSSNQYGPRILLNQMKDTQNLSKIQILRNNLSRFHLKTLLLPKFYQLDKYLEQVELRNYSKDLQLITILKQYCQSDIILRKDINTNMIYKPTSQLDVLRMSLLPLRKRKEQELKSFRSQKLKFYYKLQEDRQILQQIYTSDKKVASDRCIVKSPYRRSVRFEVKKSHPQSISSKHSVEFERQDEFAKKMQQIWAPTKSMVLPESKPFRIRSQATDFLLINGVYLDYTQLSRKINQQLLPLNKFTAIGNFQESYLNLRRKEAEKKIIRKKNWSGQNVMKASVKQMIQFHKIFKSLNSKDIEIWLTTLSGVLRLLRKYAYYLINFQVSKLFFDFIILMNTIFLSLQGIIDRNIIDRVEDIATVILSIEIILQMFVYKPKRIAKNKHYIIEALIIMLGLIEFGFSDYLNVDEQYLRLMRATKCLLFYRCIKYIEMARIIGAIAQITYRSYIYLTFLMFFMVFTFGLIGMELYGDEFHQQQRDGYLHSFDDPIKGSMTVFNIMTNDDWYGVFRQGTSINRTLAIIYSYSMIFVLNYFIYGIVMAILLDGFSQYLEREYENQDNEFINKKIKVFNKLNKQLESDDNNSFTNTESSSSASSSEDEGYKKISRNVQLQRNSIFFKKENGKDNFARRASVFPGLQAQAIPEHSNNLAEEQKKLKQTINKTEKKIKGTESKALLHILEAIKFIEKSIQRKKNVRLYQGVACDDSLYIFPKSNRFRKFCYRITQNLLTKIILNLVLICSILIIAIQDTVNTQQLQMFCNIVFLINYPVNIIACGAYIDKGSYIDCVWKIVDLLYLVAYFFIEIGVSDAPVFKVLLTFVYFRPIKYLYRINWVAQVTAALAQSLYDIVNVFFVLIMVWLMFAVFAMMLYADKFGFCEEIYTYDIGKTECESEQREWVTYKHNFDNITTAMPTLFVTSTFDGWGQILWVAQNSREATKGPEPYYSQVPTYIFFFAFCFIGSMFLLNLFTGVLFINFKANKKQLENDALSQYQLEFIKISSMILKDHPVYSAPPTTKLRKYAAYFTNAKYVQLIVYIILILNSIDIMMFYHGANELYLDNLNKFHHICTLFYIFWVVLSMLSSGFNRYFDNWWRRYYCLVILLGIVDFVLDKHLNWFKEYSQSNQLTPHYQLYRLLYLQRILRIIIVFQGLRNVQRLVRVMSYSFPFLIKILFILMIVMVVYAFFGMNLFGHIDKGEVINDLINFHSFELALLTLFKCASGDDFRSIMNDCMQHNPYCKDDPKYCGSQYAQVYFISFMLISNYVLINLFVLGMIEQFELFFNNQDSILQTYVENVDRIKNIWCRYSRTDGSHMDLKFLPHFLIDIEQPLGGQQDDNIWDTAKLAQSYKLKCYESNEIHFTQVMYELFRTRYKPMVFKSGNEEAREEMKQFGKEMQFRLVYYRRGRQYKRSNIGPQLNLKGNSNVLNYQMSALLCFRAWSVFARQQMEKVTTEQQQVSISLENRSMKREISEQSVEIGDNNNLDQPIYRKQTSQKLKRVSLYNGDNFSQGDQLNVRQSIFKAQYIQEQMDLPVEEEGVVQQLRSILRNN